MDLFIDIAVSSDSAGSSDVAVFLDSAVFSCIWLSSLQQVLLPRKSLVWLIPPQLQDLCVCNFTVELEIRVDGLSFSCLKCSSD